MEATHMTVRQLVEWLQQQEQDLPVIVSMNEYSEELGQDLLNVVQYGDERVVEIGVN